MVDTCKEFFLPICMFDISLPLFKRIPLIEHGRRCCKINAQHFRQLDTSHQATALHGAVSWRLGPSFYSSSAVSMRALNVEQRNE